jgi:hypothetical protein
MKTNRSYFSFVGTLFIWCMALLFSVRHSSADIWVRTTVEFFGGPRGQTVLTPDKKLNPTEGKFPPAERQDNVEENAETSRQR